MTCKIGQMEKQGSILQMVAHDDYVLFSKPLYTLT